jgi:Zn-dependent metalloprotease
VPRTASLNVTATDGLGDVRQINVGDFRGSVVLRDTTLNVHTYDFAFGDPDVEAGRLPGNYVKYLPQVDPMAVSAHANASAVVEFLRTVLLRQCIDNKGGPLISTINCVLRSDAKPGNVWFNAYWDPSKDQMVYGQVLVNGKLRSLATSQDIVAHEIFHGVTQKTADLEYAKQSGALNEALSDVFGVIISNLALPIASWNWELGDGLEDEPLRDMADPTRYGQPKHMDKY